MGWLAVEVFDGRLGRAAVDASVGVVDAGNTEGGIEETVGVGSRGGA